MRCWVGTEVEHNLNYQTETLFVESAVVDFKVLTNLINDLNKEYNFKSIYLGAGEKNVLCCFNLQLLKDLSHRYNIIVECTVENLHFIVDSFKNSMYNCIVRVETEAEELENISLKIRNNKEVLICNYNKNGTNSLENSQNNLYSDTDILVFDDEV